MDSLRLVRKWTGTATLTATSLWALLCGAQDIPHDINVEKPDRGWEFLVTPYAFVPTVDADTTVAGTTVKLDLGFDDIIDNFDVLAFSTLIEARRDRWGFFVNIFYLSLDSKTFDIHAPLPVPIVPGVNVDVEQIQVDFGPMYRFYDAPVLDGDGNGYPNLVIDGLVGARYMSLKQDLDVGLGPATVGLGGKEDWFEPMVGGRVALNTSEKLMLKVGGSAGGFGLEDASDLSANIVTGLGYQATERVQLRCEYQFYWLDYSTTRRDGEFGFDGFLHGPWLGLTIAF